MFDFDSNGFINAEDVRILLSYIPFKHIQKGSSMSSASETSGNGSSLSLHEGIYDCQEGHNLDENQRNVD